MSSLSKVSIGIKTFLRDSHLFDAIAAIRSTMPEVEMVIADDGRSSTQKNDLYSEIQKEGHLVAYFEFDAGFGYKSNSIAQFFRREYLLIASDDFDFHPASVVRGIEKLVDVLDHSDVDIASGRVNGHPYEFDLEDLGDKVIEHRLEIPNYGEHAKLWYIGCDLTVNYSLMKRRVFESISWDDDQKIGQGEHGSFFVDAKRAGLRTAYVPGVNITTQRKPDPLEYRPYRSRAASPERSCFKKRGIKTYILGDGRVDYQKDSLRCKNPELVIQTERTCAL